MAKDKYKELDEILGNEEALSCFKDNKPREVFPVTMRNFSKFMNNVSSINVDDLWVNYLKDDGQESIEEVLKLSFPNENMDELLDLINAENFPIIMKKILSKNGIKIDNEAEGDQGKKE